MRTPFGKTESVFLKVATSVGVEPKKEAGGAVSGERTERKMAGMM